MKHNELQWTILMTVHLHSGLHVEMAFQSNTIQQVYLLDRVRF